MTGAKIRLAVAGLLFFGWLVYLGYLVLTKTNPVIVSRSQVMAATHFVLADVTVDPATGHPNRAVTVVRDLRPVGAPLAGTIIVMNIKDARIGGVNDFSAGGPFLLPLTPLASQKDTYELTPPPRSPGTDSLSRPRPWAYRWDAPGVQRQFDELVRERP
jgi:hypothetical protein